jgi:hypothetical protein
MRKASGEWRVMRGDRGLAEIPTSDPGRRTSHRYRGMTLVEVLMSMLVMGIGVLSVVALLPLAFVRAVNATNLTNGTILRFNAEAQLYLDQLDLEYVFPNWQPNTTYVAGANPSIVLSATGNNNVRFVVQTAGVSGGTEPIWNTTIGGNTTDGGVTWTAVDHSHYVIDPLCWNTMALAGSGLQGALGNNRGTLGTVGAPPNGTAIERFNAGINAGNAAGVSTAAQLVTLPDSWVQQARGPATNIQLNSVDLAGVDLTGVSYTATPGPTPTINSRAVLTDASGKVSETRLITGISVAGTTSTISWGGAPPAAAPGNDPLLTGFTPAQVRVETQDRRYTWMLTVRRTSSGFPNVDVTTFFNRTLTADDEQTYASNGSGLQFTVNYGGSPKPFVKKGGFLFDVTYGRWYRITSFTDNGTQLTVAVSQSRPSTDGSTFTVVFMRGVVNVYSFPLKS